MEDMGIEVDDSSESIQEFQLILDELVGDESMGKVRGEYEKLIQVLLKSRENEKRLMSKCRELNAKIVSTTTKVADALKMRQEDETKMNFLKRELDKAWKMVDVTHEDTKKDKETIRTLKEEIVDLNKKLDQQPGVLTDQDQIDQVKLNDKLMEERDQLQIVVDELREKLDNAFVSQQEVESQRDAALDDISQVQQEIQLLQNEISREIRLKDKLDKELRQLQLDMEGRMGEIKSLNVQAHKAREEQQKLEHQIRELKGVNERYSKELEQMQAKNSKLQQELEQLSSAKEHLALENLRSANQLKMREEDLSQMKHEAAKQTRLKETNQRKLRQMEEQKADMETQKEMLKAHISALEKDLETSQKLVENEKKCIEELIRERDTLSKNMIKSAKAAEKQQSLVKVLEQEKKTLEHEINGYRQKAQQERKIIQQLEKERDRYINENGNLIQKVQQKMSDNEVREGEIYEWKKKVTEAECKIKQQEHVLESVVGERNLYSKNLIESQEEMVEIKRNMGIMSNQVSRLRDEITGKELALAKDQQEHKRLEKNNDVLKAELQSMKLQLEETKQLIESQKVEQQKLQKIITDTDAEVFQLKKHLEQVGRDRDNLGKHLLRRNNECSLLYEKIRIQQSVLSKGDFHYNQRMKDISLLRLELRRLRRKKSILDSTSSDTDDLRRKLFYLQKELLKERTRNTTLEEQLKPVNIHRWRLLEGNDPGKFELILKIQSLQKRLIVKTQGLEERELLLQEKEKLYVELKHIMAKQPGPEVAEQLYHSQKSLQEQTKKLRAMTARLEVFDSKINDYKNENQTLTNELTSFKKKYFSQKKLYSEQQAKHKEREPEALPQRSSRALVRDGLTRIDTPSI